jgi:uncharacterized spore protein YtfJ
VNVSEILAMATESAHVKRVFGEPIEREGALVIPVATVIGGMGGGQGTQGDGSEQGSGAGLGIVARPAGMYVIKGDNVAWRPALDLNRVILGGQAVAVVALLVRRSIFRRR